MHSEGCDGSEYYNVTKKMNKNDEIIYLACVCARNRFRFFKYFEDIEKRIPRNEIDEYKNKLNDVFAKCTPSGSTFEIVGSYRRGTND